MPIEFCGKCKSQLDKDGDHYHLTDCVKKRVALLEVSLHDCASKLESQISRNPELPPSYRDVVKTAFDLLR